MLQEIQGQLVYVVELEKIPELPITGVGEEWLYARVLNEAIQTGVITMPGKYGIRIIEVDNDGQIYWAIAHIIE